MDSARKKAEQLKWRETWDTETQLRNLKKSVEHGFKTVEPKQFALPIPPALEKPSVLLPNRNPGSRGASPAPSQGSRHGHFFITDEAGVEPERPREKTRHSSRPKERVDTQDYPWEKRERSREQYRSLTKQT